MITEAEYELLRKGYIVFQVHTPSPMKPLANNLVRRGYLLRGLPFRDSRARLCVPYTLTMVGELKVLDYQEAQS
jgi:hypothetical protein